MKNKKPANNLHKKESINPNLIPENKHSKTVHENYNLTVNVNINKGY
jgi:hypothetical protein